MIVRTYGRRSRGGIGRTLSDSTLNGDVSDDPFSYSEEEEEEESPQDYNFTYSSSQESARWTFDSESFSLSQDGGLDPPRVKPLLEPLGGSKKAKIEKGETRFNRPPPPFKAPPPPTATLMETQEFGEMTEYVDEVNFALDGLKSRHPVRVRRASLLSLLTICETSQQRRILRANGIEKTIADAIMGLSLDDSPSNLAASALFYILTADGQDNYLLDLSSSIGFLKRLLKPLKSDNIVKSTSSISSKLLALRKDAHFARDMTKKLDESDDAIAQKVKEILVSCKDIKARDDNDKTSQPELSPKWIALLTMQKACISNVAFEEGAVRRTGGKFKEKLRELGGLNAVFELALSFQSSLERWLGHVSAPKKVSKDEENLQYLVLLSKCLKVMENATFLSQENQSHLLEMRRFLTETKSSLSFTKLVVNFVKILSDISLLRRNSLACSAVETPLHFSIDSEQSFEFLSVEEKKADRHRVSLTTSSEECSSSGRVFQGLGLNKSQRKQWLSSQSESQEPETAYVEDNCMIKMRIRSSTSSSSSMNSNRIGCGSKINGAHAKMKTSLGKRPCDSQDPFAFDEDDVSVNLEDRSSNRIGCGTKINGAHTKMKTSLGKRPCDSQDPFAFDEDDISVNLEDSLEDPFAFDEDEVNPSKWDILSHKNGAARPKRSRLGRKDFEDASSSRIISKPEVKRIENQHSSQTSCSSVVGEEASEILADCLLTAVKVLMNLTNDNEVGCQQIAACGGLEIISSLIVNHFPSFLQPLHSPSEMRDFDSLCNSAIDLESQTDVRLTDQEIDLLVAILGLLVNMVEKNDTNRSRLAATSISLPGSRVPVEESQRDIIPLLCSIFLANQGAGEAVGEANETWDEETVLLQGEKEAEKMIIEAYSALLLAFLSNESRSTREIIAGYLPTKKLSVLVPVLERFVAFHVTLDMISPETHKSVNEVIESLKLA